MCSVFLVMNQILTNICTPVPSREVFKMDLLWGCMGCGGVREEGQKIGWERTWFGTPLNTVFNIISHI